MSDYVRISEQQQLRQMCPQERNQWFNNKLKQVMDVWLIRIDETKVGMGVDRYEVFAQFNAAIVGPDIVRDRNRWAG